MNDEKILKWIKANLAAFIQMAIAGVEDIPEDLLAALTCRETGGLIVRYVANGLTVKTMAPVMKGDFSQRPGETEKSYHGFGFTQIDIAAYPQFIKSGGWKNPLQCYQQTVMILQANSVWMASHFPTYTGDLKDRAMVAAYNCGLGNVRKAIQNGSDIDHYTTGKNYSAQIWEFRDIYKNLQTQ